jgi:hypothetical protein
MMEIKIHYPRFLEYKEELDHLLDSEELDKTKIIDVVNRAMTEAYKVGFDVGFTILDAVDENDDIDEPFAIFEEEETIDLSHIITDIDNIEEVEE